MAASDSFENFVSSKGGKYYLLELSLAVERRLGLFNIGGV